MSRLSGELENKIRTVVAGLKLDFSPRRKAALARRFTQMAHAYLNAKEKDRKKVLIAHRRRILADFGSPTKKRKTTQ